MHFVRLVFVIKAFIWWPGNESIRSAMQSGQETSRLAGKQVDWPGTEAIARPPGPPVGASAHAFLARELRHVGHDTCIMTMVHACPTIIGHVL